MIYVLVIVCIFLCEWFLKNIVEAFGREKEKKEILGGRIYLTKYHNEGAFLNLGEKKKKLVAAVSMGLSVFCLILFILSFSRKGNTLLRTGLSLLLGGAFSNTYDRLKRGYVVDYFGFRLKGFEKLSKVVFNLSDFFIIIGAMLTAIASVE